MKPVKASKFTQLVYFIFFVYIFTGIFYALFTKNPELNIFRNYKGEFSFKYITWFLCVYLFSHVLRIIRLYTLLLEEKVRVGSLLRVYFTTSWINFLLPYKLGEIFRITEIGNLCKSFRRGIVTIWIERFFDAVILSSFIFGYFIFYDSTFGKFIPIAIVLIIFVAFSLLYFLEFTYTFKYLTSFLITKSNTRRGIHLLKLANSLDKIHADIKQLIRGRTSLLLFLSIAIWTMELTSVFILSKLFNINSLAQSFIVLLNDSLVSTISSNIQLISLYQSIALSALIVLAIPFIAVAVKLNILSWKAERANLKQKNYRHKESLVDLNEWEHVI
ncbi:lysylphosphatidylglycerol synthase domain-containing protein [Paenibacillus camerounensis]|uniref:lysylphosphatidylglycerol synthase domain-containing protein n=1 Tax=Paenibacillus camerounensis TaxID=1243663 RepID=UPI0005A63D5A|nr:lysylphosphatidylglycerol synthase domain-containing protein [Paenibacillus camerounensis]